MQKSLFVIQGVVVIHLMYGALQWMEKGVFLPVLPLTAIFCAIIAFTASMALRNQRFQKIIWVFLGTTFLLSSELIIESFFGQFQGVQIRETLFPITTALIGIFVIMLCFLFVKFIHVHVFLKGLYGVAVLFGVVCLLWEKIPNLIGLSVILIVGQWAYLKDQNASEKKQENIKLIHVSLQSIFLVHSLNEITMLFS